jgi:hypothetical protein
MSSPSIEFHKIWIDHSRRVRPRPPEALSFWILHDAESHQTRGGPRCTR